MPDTITETVNDTVTETDIISGRTKHGEWGKWLEESVDFSQSRVYKLMRIFKEYGAGQLTSSNLDSNPNLNYSQAVLLLGIPKEERAQFIVDMDVEA